MACLHWVGVYQVNFDSGLHHDRLSQVVTADEAVDMAMQRMGTRGCW